jgi:hypothetical protein
MTQKLNMYVEVLQGFLNLDPIDYEKSDIPPYSTDR